jgi:hypothetical protein
MAGLSCFTRTNVGLTIDARLTRARFKVLVCFDQAVDCECACLRGSQSEAAQSEMKESLLSMGRNLGRLRNVDDQEIYFNLESQLLMSGPWVGKSPQVQEGSHLFHKKINNI